MSKISYVLNNLAYMKELTSEIALLIDQSIGLKQIADLGEW